MKLVVLYEHKRYRAELEEALTSAGHTVTLCKNSSDFLEVAENLKADRLIIDVKSWYRGAAIYNYFTIGEQLNALPALFFDAPEGFSSIEDRAAQAGDIVLEKERSVDAILAALA